MGAMWRRARATEGLVADRSTIQLLDDDDEVAGVMRIAWQNPSSALATIWKLEWDPELAGESDLWDLIDDLSPVVLEHTAA